MAPKKKARLEPNVEVPDGDPDVGKKIFEASCAACHALEGKGTPADTAPPLGGLIGRQTGATGFAYSKAVKNAGFEWSQKHLWMFLAGPGKYIPGNRMAFGGIPNETDRAHLIAYLASN